MQIPGNHFIPGVEVQDLGKRLRLRNLDSFVAWVEPLAGNSSGFCLSGLSAHDEVNIYGSKYVYMRQIEQQEEEKAFLGRLGSTCYTDI